MDTAARHLLIEFHGCDPAVLNDADRLRALMREAAQAAQVTVVSEVIHRYAPHGVTGVFVIEESHFSVHTWPEAGYAALDFYTCGNCDPDLAVTVLRLGLKATQTERLLVRRGLPGSGTGIRVCEHTCAPQAEQRLTKA